MSKILLLILNSLNQGFNRCYGTNIISPFSHRPLLNIAKYLSSLLHSPKNSENFWKIYRNCTLLVYIIWNSSIYWTQIYQFLYNTIKLYTIYFLPSGLSIVKTAGLLFAVVEETVEGGVTSFDFTSVVDMSTVGFGDGLSESGFTNSCANLDSNSVLLLFSWRYCDWSTRIWFDRLWTLVVKSLSWKEKKTF